MSIDEVIEKIEENFNAITNENNWENNEVEEYYSGYEDAKCFATSVLRDYKKEQTVEIPQWLADFIETKREQERYSDRTMLQVILRKADSEDNTFEDGQRNYVIWNYDTIAKAILNGYTVKEESEPVIGEYYFETECRIIYQVIEFVDEYKEYKVKAYDNENGFYTDNWNKRYFEEDFKDDIKATDEQIAEMKRAEMYHKRGRKLDELKIGDVLYSRINNQIVTVNDDTLRIWKDSLRENEGYKLVATREELIAKFDEVTE